MKPSHLNDAYCSVLDPHLPFEDITLMTHHDLYRTIASLDLSSKPMTARYGA